MKRGLVAVLWAAVLGGCAPSINGQMKANTDTLLAGYRGGRGAEAAGAFAPAPWAVGQWVAFKTVDEKGEPTLFKMGVVGEEEGGTWVEMETQSYYRHGLVRLLFLPQPGATDDGVDLIRRVLIAEDGKQPQSFDFSDPMMAFARSMMRGYTRDMFAPRVVAQSTREDVTVVAGTFPGCTRLDVEVQGVGRSQAWVHPGVPLNATVKSVSEDGKQVTELLDFGMTGAKSALSR